MKIGSVRFFKTLILAVAALLILVSLTLAILFGSLYAGQKKRMQQLESLLALQQPGLAVLPPPKGVTPSAAPQPGVEGTSSPSFAYQQMYPYLYTDAPTARTAEKGVCYLTFDDGPSSVTQQVLDVLQETGVKATFFVTGKASETNEDVLKAVSDAGHTVGIHTYSHDYEAIYASVTDFLADFDEMYRKILEVTGAAPEIFRFPGGSVNVFNQDIYVEVVAEMIRRGFTFFDWSAAASDAVKGGLTRQQVTSNVLNSAKGQDRVIVLMHDRPDNTTTAAALPDVIEGLRAQGYRFESLTSGVEPITYYYAASQQ